jgi:NADP-dependent 3-hydroxy acid dehydrogenase YdfG
LYKGIYSATGIYHTKLKAYKWVKQLQIEGFNIELFYEAASDYESIGKMIAAIEVKYGHINRLIHNFGVDVVMVVPEKVLN